jgi:hypothetical protein
VAECKKSNNCKSPHSYLSRHRDTDTEIDIPHVPSLQGGSSQHCEYQRPSQRAEQTFEVTNERLDTLQSYDQSDDDSFEIKSSDLKS